MAEKWDVSLTGFWSGDFVADVTVGLNFVGGSLGIRLHDARHTHASLLLKQGVHPKIVQERLGHGSIQITLDTYSHVAPDLQQTAANTFYDIILLKNTSIYQ